MVQTQRRRVGGGGHGFSRADESRVEFAQNDHGVKVVVRTNAHLVGMVVGSFGHSSYRPHVVPIEVSETMSQPVVEEEI